MAHSDPIPMDVPAMGSAYGINSDSAYSAYSSPSFHSAKTAESVLAQAVGTAGFVGDIDGAALSAHVSDDDIVLPDFETIGHRMMSRDSLYEQHSDDQEGLEGAEHETGGTTATTTTGKDPVVSALAAAARNEIIRETPRVTKMDSV